MEGRPGACRVPKSDETAPGGAHEKAPRRAGQEGKMLWRSWTLILLCFNLAASYLTVDAVHTETVPPERIYLMIFFQGIAWTALMIRLASGPKAPRS